ncbi:unnamed protein product [Rhodiola kirilowii]
MYRNLQRKTPKLRHNHQSLRRHTCTVTQQKTYGSNGNNESNINNRFQQKK